MDAWLDTGGALESVSVFGLVNVPITLIEPDRRTRASSSWVSSTFFDVVGVRPSLGRILEVTDESGDAPRAAVISDGFWKRLFGADARIVGRTVRMQRGVAVPPQLIEIVGVMPAGFDFPRDVDVWLPAAPIPRSIAVVSPATGPPMSRGTSLTSRCSTHSGSCATASR